MHPTSDLAPTALWGWTLAMLDELVPDVGERRAIVLANVGREPPELPDARVPDAVMRVLWSELPPRANDPDYGLSFAQRVSERALGVLGYVARHSATLGGAIERVIRLQRLAKDPGTITLHTRGDAIAVCDGPALGRPAWPRHLAEAVLASYVAWGTRWTGTRVEAREVAFQHPTPESTDAHRALFGCRPRFGAPTNQIVLDASVLSRAIEGADTNLALYLERAAEAALRDLPDEDAWLGHARAVMRALLREGEHTVAGLAAGLGTSPRTLQRRLAANGRSFQLLLDEVRAEVARELLAERMRVDEIASRLGFSDPSGFRRAYRRWTASGSAKDRGH